MPSSVMSHTTNPCRLFVGSIPFHATKTEVEAHFTEAGPIKDLYLPPDRERGDGRNKGFAFVEFHSPEAAETALSLYDGSTLQGRRLRVSVAEAKAS